MYFTPRIPVAACIQHLHCFAPHIRCSGSQVLSGCDTWLDQSGYLEHTEEIRTGQFGGIGNLRGNDHHEETNQRAQH